jgi:hypothetical protein
MLPGSAVQLRLMAPNLLPPAGDVIRFWRRRILKARRRHRESTAEFQRVLEEKRREAAATAEGLHEVLKARFEEADALSEYLEVLRVYTMLVKGPESGTATYLSPLPIGQTPQ